MRYIRTSQHGFSLVEVLVTVVVLAVGLIATARFQGTVLQGSSLARERSEAVALAEQKIEQLRNYRDVTNSTSALDYSDITTAAYCAASPGTTESSLYTNGGNTGNTVYSRTCTSSASPPSGNYSYITITVTVTWSRPGASTQDATDATVTLSSIITNANPRYSGQVT